MRVFVGYGYNNRDLWIEEKVFPILRGMGFTVVHGRDMYGDVLPDEVQKRIDQSDAAIGFFTIRDGQHNADYTSHIWVRDEMMYAMAKGKPIIPVMEDGVRVPDSLLGNRQFIPLSMNDKLSCVVNLLVALGQRNLLRVRLDTDDDSLAQLLFTLKKTPSFCIRYRTRDVNGVESDYINGRLEIIDYGFYLNVINVPTKGYIEIEGVLNDSIRFSSGWTSIDAISVKIF